MKQFWCIWKFVVDHYFAIDFKVDSYREPLQNCFKTYKYCDNTREYCNCRWPHFQGLAQYSWVLPQYLRVLSQYLRILSRRIHPKFETLHVPIHIWTGLQVRFCVKWQYQKCWRRWKKGTRKPKSYNKNWLIGLSHLWILNISWIMRKYLRG